MRRVSGWIGLVVGAVACSQSGSGAVCGSVTVAGQCTGAVLEYCSLTTNQLVRWIAPRWWRMEAQPTPAS